MKASAIESEIFCYFILEVSYSSTNTVKIWTYNFDFYQITHINKFGTVWSLYSVKIRFKSLSIIHFLQRFTHLGQKSVYMLLINDF